MLVGVLYVPRLRSTVTKLLSPFPLVTCISMLFTLTREVVKKHIWLASSNLSLLGPLTSPLIRVLVSFPRSDPTTRFTDRPIRLPRLYPRVTLTRLNENIVVVLPGNVPAHVPLLL